MPAGPPSLDPRPFLYRLQRFEVAGLSVNSILRRLAAAQPSIRPLPYAPVFVYAPPAHPPESQAAAPALLGSQIAPRRARATVLPIQTQRQPSLATPFFFLL